MKREREIISFLQMQNKINFSDVPTLRSKCPSLRRGSGPTTPWDSEVCHLQAFRPLEICFFFCKTQRGRGDVTGSGLLRLAPRLSVRIYQGKVRASAVKMQPIITESSNIAMLLTAWSRHLVVVDSFRSSYFLFSRVLYCELASSPTAMFRSKQSLWAKT